MNTNGQAKAKFKRHKRLSASAIFVIVVVALSFASWAFFRSTRTEIPYTAAASSDSGSLSFDLNNEIFVPPRAHVSAGRPIYPYSVIPGGIVSSRELRAAIQSDSVIRSHYSDFHLRSAHVIRLAKKRRAYVSYRLGDRIFWTKKKVTILAGETVLSDGMHLARARCGNRISDVPMAPTSPAEPGDGTLNPPVAPRPPDLTTESLPIVPIWANSPVPILPPVTNAPNPPYAPGSPIFPPPLIPICCGSSPVPPLTTPPIATPEPSAWLLLVAGLAAFFLMEKLRTR